MNWNNQLGCYCINQLNELNLNELITKKISLLIFDIRGTIIINHQINSHFAKLMEQINDANCFKILFATNNCSYYTNKVRHELVGINCMTSYLYFACKPLLFRIKHQLKCMGLINIIKSPINKIAVIGNQLNTDGKLASKLHALLIYLLK